MAAPPFFPYYGSKWRDAKRYPPPREGHVIEPFAGSAGYSLWHMPERVTLLEIDPIVVGVWRYLTGVTAREVLALPDLELGCSTDDLAVPQEARWLIGFWINRGSAQPKKSRTAYSTRVERQQLTWGERARQRIAAHLHLIADWEVKEASYVEAPLVDSALYFVDPPYVDKGRYYRCHDVDHAAIGEWVKSLPGQVVVCEQAGAEWLPFEPLASIKSTRGRSAEVVYLQGDVQPAIVPGCSFVDVRFPGAEDWGFR